MRDRATTALIAADALPLGQKMLAEMSTGEARRVLIARALVSGPRALLLDEPTAGLDLTSRRRFLYAIGQLSRAGKSVILVTHHVEEIFPEIDRVILMKDGKVFDDGPKASILTSERLTALFDDTIRVRHAHGLYSAEIELLSDPG
jgi:iron complex transport system ATP-binding protein